MPSNPSGENCEDSKPDEYVVAAPSRCLVAVKPPRVTVSVYCSPDTEDPSPYESVNVSSASLDVLLEDGSYFL